MGTVPIPAVFVTIDPDRLPRLARFLHSAARVEAGYTNPDPTWAGSPGSMADRDGRWTAPGVAADKTIRAVDTTYAAARLGLIAVTDHAASLGRLITDPDLTGCLAVEAVARSAVETAARSWWLVEPGLTARQRVARFLADQLFSAYRAKDMARRMNWPTGVAGISPEANEIKAKCDELGLDYDANQSAPTVDGQRRPGATPLVAALMHDTIYSASYPLVYALTSATTHGTHFALMRAYVDSGDKHEGEAILDRRLDHRQIEPVCGVVLEAFAATLRGVVQVARWGWTKVDGYQSPIRNFLYTMPY
jgi:hypothetical protein